AIKYTKENGHIKITINKMESYVRIDIKDNGIGIPNKETNNIFKRFYRGTSKTVQESEGSGVGLYLTRKILELQGGCITVKSELGKGTVFSLFLQNC
ncbi:MAG: ATP-binding protein, partial [Clostridiaceae bacterium]|nr:ATP-binding protein [Clostridiaceae bacterium]